MRVFELFWLATSVARLKTVTEANAGVNYYKNCSNVLLVYKNAFVQHLGFVALRFDVRRIAKNEKLNDFKDISFVEQRPADNSTIFYLLQFRIGLVGETVKMDLFHIQDESYQCNNELFGLEMTLTSNPGHFMNAVKDTNYCEDYELRKVYSNFKIFKFRNAKKHILIAGNRSFDIEETATGLLSIKVSTKFNEDEEREILKAAEQYRKLNCPNNNIQAGSIGYLFAAFFIFPLAIYSCYHVFQIIRNHSVQFPNIIRVYPYVP